MASFHQLGKMGEDIAANYFAKRGYCIVARNWRYAHYEIDLIVSQKEILHFVEVKTRKSNQFGYPEAYVTAQKTERLKNAAMQYLFLHPEWHRIQFDILSVTCTQQGYEVFYLEDCC